MPVYAQITTQLAFPNITVTSPVDLQSPDDDKDRIFVVSQSGTIVVFPNNPAVTATKTFLDITDRVTSGGELGLLGLAFHPNYKNNGYFYVNYTAPNPRRTVIARYSVSQTNPDSADKNSELILFTFDQPFSNHNGGQVMFGPDGYLYIATGDGGSSGDPNGNGQNKSVLLGKILRIDVNRQSDPLPYAIPPDNPFANNTQGWKKEIFTYGMRNPWRFCFDTETNLMYCADVGQGAWEEVDILVNGGNYGWKIMEGNHCYNATTCDTTGLIKPIWEYAHNSSGGYSITGGYVYRGPNVPELTGKYICGDYVSKRIWTVQYSGPGQVNAQVLIDNSNIAMSSFGLDKYGEMYILYLSTGKIYKFTPTAPVLAPTALSATIQGNGVRLNWTDNSPNESGFYIERKSPNGSYIVHDSVAANTAQYTDTRVSANVSYTYRVRAFSSGGRSGYSNAVTLLSTVPVELVSFSGMYSGGKVHLRWKTATEKNNRGFTVIRRVAGRETTAGFIPGKGTITQPSEYSFTDNILNENITDDIFYVLRQTDYDGTINEAGTVKIDASEAQGGILSLASYPNPFSGTAEIRCYFPQPADIRLAVFNTLGEQVTELASEKVTRGYRTFSFNASGLGAGMYVVRLVAYAGNGRTSSSAFKKIMYFN